MKFLKWFLIVLVSIGLLIVFVGWPYMKKQTKKISPEQTEIYANNGLDLAVNYSAPFKKNRVIFGELVPYNAVWRTGANEPTTFTTSSAIKIIDKNLPAGTYSFWTKPNKDSWVVIFNKEVPGWGVSFLSGGSETSRDAKEDIIEIEVPVTNLTETVERLTFGFEDENQLVLTLAWDKTKISIPINK
ncbi:MAG: DUF2911 domain-containing protein [Cellulophaga sp.]